MPIGLVTRNESEAEGTADQQNAIQKSTPVISSQSDTGTAGNAGFSTPPNQIRERVRFEQLPSAQQTAINQALVSLLSKKGYNGQSLGASANSPTSLQELLAALEKANSIPEGHTILRNTTMTRLEWDMLANQMAAASAAQQPSASVYDNQGLPTGITGQSAAQILSHLPPDAQAKMKMYFANDMKGMMNAGMMNAGSQALSSEDPPMLQSMGNWFLKRKYLLATPINPFGTLLFLASDTTDDDLSMMAWGVTEDPAGMAKAVGDGAVISGKIAVNGTATVVTQTVTLGIYDDQIYLIPVSEDEIPYYQNGSVYFQAGGHLLTAVAPGGLLTKFGHLPRAATFAKGLAIFDQLGNAVQTSQGIYDMTQKGVNFSNLMSVGFGGLGLGGQIGAVWKAKAGSVEDVFASISWAKPKWTNGLGGSFGTRQHPWGQYPVGKKHRGAAHSGEPVYSNYEHWLIKLLPFKNLKKPSYPDANWGIGKVKSKAEWEEVRRHELDHIDLYKNHPELSHLALRDLTEKKNYWVGAGVARAYVEFRANWRGYQGNLPLTLWGTFRDMDHFTAIADSAIIGAIAYAYYTQYKDYFIEKTDR